jgi:hypothetical protein
MNRSTIPQLCRRTSLVLYILAGVSVWFAINAWILVRRNHHAIEAVAMQFATHTAMENNALKTATHE